MAGVIGEPYYGDGDKDYEWVGWENWTFYRNFVAPGNIRSSRNVKLVAHGIDTACTVTLNGNDALSTSDMFVRYEVDVTTMLRRNNSIVVSCESPVAYALRKHEVQVNMSSPVQPLCPPEEQRGQCHVNMIRKMPCSFGWDWGPAFPSTGIWKPIELVAFNQAFIQDVTVTTTLKRGTNFKADRWRINVGVFFKLSQRARRHGTISISLDDTVLHSSLVHFTKLRNRGKSQGDYAGKAAVPVDIPQAIQIERWWPSGYGNQKLYRLNVSMSVDGERCDKVIRFGFRTVDLVEDVILHFYDYWENAWDPANYPIPRFMSEFGLLSHPSVETMKQVAPDSTLVFPFSPFLETRQHHSGGRTELERSLSLYFGLVPSSDVNGTEYGYAMVSYLSQPAASSLDAFTVSLYSLWNSSSCSSKECFLWSKLEDTLTGSFLAPEAYVLPVLLGDASLMQATVKVTSVTGPSYERNEYTYRVDLSTDNVAPFVWLDPQAMSGRFSDNGFLLREPAKTVQFRTSENVTADQLREAIAIYTISDCTFKEACPMKGSVDNKTVT
ncbi:hypothetical protein HPB50_003808 [Hyalomma asiaticum]|uniref:Uncharacterized protein n=1 Tax=Hyalomma asiaticum TaxID=266040 RepID=A0ACB7S6G6_HYAAI|nr:hypothetical protein HPB50_003808 [Hyalomma asiaticum]